MHDLFFAFISGYGRRFLTTVYTPKQKFTHTGFFVIMAAKAELYNIKNLRIRKLLN